MIFVFHKLYVHIAHLVLSIPQTFTLPSLRPQLTRQVSNSLDQLIDSHSTTPEEKTRITVAENREKVYEIETCLPPLM